MARQIVWFGAIAFLALLASFYGITVFQKTFFLIGLQGETKAVIKEWHAKEGESGYFYPYAYFTYEVEGKTYQGSSFYKKQYARNPYALSPILHEIAEEPLTAFYNKKSPHIVSLEKDYPYKEALKMAVIVGVCLYFLSLKRRQGHLKHSL